VRHFWDSLDARGSVRKHALKQWEVERTLLYLAPRDDILVTNFRPFLRGVRPWTAGWLGEMVGVGLARAALEEARELDEPQLGEAGHGYFRAVLGELHFHAGEYEEAIEVGENALELLQPDNVLLRMRAAGYIAASMAELGGRNQPRAVALLREALHRYPTVVRQLNMRVPATITHDADPFAQEVAERLLDSPRLDTEEAAAPFQVHVSGDRKKLTMCLSTRDGFRLGCGDKTFERPGDDDEDAALACDAFHEGAFSPMVELTSRDINSLDGSTVRANADEVLKGILRPDVIEDEEDD
jgi:tetratricopeptide (TPR) repeat protein